MWQPLSFAPDLLGVDAITLMTAVVTSLGATVVRWARRIQPAATRRKLVLDMLNGSVIYPFLLLIYCVFDHAAFKYLEPTSLSVGLAGVVGMVFVLGELSLSCSPEANGGGSRRLF
jgi:hypothetical protein